MGASRWNQEQQEFYDSTEANFEQNNPYFRFILERYVGAIRPQPREKVLEMGSSGGRFTLPLLERGCQVTGVDISARSIERLDKLSSSHPQRAHLRLLDDDVGTLSKLKEHDFDAVVGAHILHHVEDMEVVLRQTFSRLRPGGRAVFLEPNAWNPQWYVQITIHPGRNWRLERGFLRMWPQKLQRLFLGAGFADCEVTTFGCFPPFMLNAVPALRSVELALERWKCLSKLFTLNLFVAHKA